MSELFSTINTYQSLHDECDFNNTYDEQAVHRTLQNALQNSYSYLDAYQRENVKFKQFHFETKSKDINYTRKTMMDEYEKLQKLIYEHPDDTSYIEQIKQQQDDLIRVDDGDYFIDEHHRPCFSIPFDIVGKENREAFRKSKFLNSEFTFEDISNNRNIFGYMPIIIIDILSYFTCKFYIDHEKLYVILPYDENFIYTDERNQILHHTDVLFINNAYAETISISEDEYRNQEIIITDDMNVINRSNGIFFGFLRDTRNPYSGMFLKLNRTNNSFKFDTSNTSYDFPDAVITIVFFDRLRQYISESGKSVVEPANYALRNTPEYPFMLFEKSLETPLDMPVPEENVLLLRLYNHVSANYPSTCISVVNRNYPNLYRISEKNHVHQSTSYSESDKYLVFYFYISPNKQKYTPMHDFYYKYLSGLKTSDKTLEEFMNDVYFSTSSDSFHSRTRYIMNMKPTNIEVSDTDFIENRDVFDCKQTYQLNKLKLFIRNDLKVLNEYANNTRRHSDMFHLFADNIDLNKRERKSSFLEDFENIGKSFFRKFTVCEHIEDDAYVVVPNDVENFNADLMIKIRDFGSFTDKPRIGSYVKLSGFVPMYVFMMKLLPKNKIHSLRIFVDGLRVFDFETTIFNDAQYIYIPKKYVNISSYIMIEDHHQSSFIKKETFTESDNKKEFSIMTMNKPLYSTDLYILDPDGYEVSKDDYHISFKNRNIENPTISEDQNTAWNNHVVLTDFWIEILNEDLFDKELEIRLVKKFESYEINMKRRGYPRLTLHDVENCRDISHIEIFCDGRLLPENLYRIDKVSGNGIQRIQILTPINKGSTVVVDISPYTHKVRGVLNTIDGTKVIDLREITNKPISIDYYDFYLNGRRLGLPNIYSIEDYGLYLKNIHSDNRLEIRERERDDEYLGFINSKNYHQYYYNRLDFMKDSFVTDTDREQIIQDIIDNQKDYRVEFFETSYREEHITVENLPSLQEEYRILYREDILPIGLLNPDLVQFDKAYFGTLFPKVKEDCLEDDVIYLNPDLRADTENTTVLLLGESDKDAENDDISFDLAIEDIYMKDGDKIVYLPDIIIKYMKDIEVKADDIKKLIEIHSSFDELPNDGDEKKIYLISKTSKFYYFDSNSSEYKKITHFEPFNLNDVIIMSPEIK